jgi:hypothetical protein
MITPVSILDWAERAPTYIEGQGYRNPLDLIEGDFIARAVVKLGRAWPLMRIFECAAHFDIGGDTGRAEQ